MPLSHLWFPELLYVRRKRELCWERYDWSASCYRKRLALREENEEVANVVVEFHDFVVEIIVEEVDDRRRWLHRL